MLDCRGNPLTVTTASKCVCGANPSPAQSVETASPVRTHHETSSHPVPARRLSKASVKKAKHGRTRSVVDGPVPLSKVSQDEEDTGRRDGESAICQKPLPNGVAQFQDEVLSPASASHTGIETTGMDTLARAQEQQPKKSCCQPKQQPATPSYTPVSNVHSFPQSMPFALPPNVGTPQHPLTPDFYFNGQQANPMYGGVNSQYIPPDVTATSFLNTTLIPTAISTGLGHTCSCGDACNCVGCAVHPYNQRMLMWVHDLNHIAHQDPKSIQPYAGHYSGFHQHPGFIPMHIPQTCHGNATANLSLQPNPAQACGLHHPEPIVSNQFPPAPFGNSPLTGTLSSGMTTCTASPENQGSWPAWPYATSADAQTSDEPGPSPSDFFYVSYPGCGTSMSSCKCGDGCTCSGCLTHAGHDGHDGLESTQQLPTQPEYWNTSPTSMPPEDLFTPASSTSGALHFPAY